MKIMFLSSVVKNKNSMTKSFYKPQRTQRFTEGRLYSYNCTEFSHVSLCFSVSSVVKNKNSIIRFFYKPQRDSQRAEVSYPIFAFHDPTENFSIC
ncbi:MAG: hypothetical protein DRI57_00595 [Deltaproteobacteria bacterium]|nr:MAG: hypothetical protein DRI57_00595 [Deltaproteobacteria bacterium]